MKQQDAYKLLAALMILIMIIVPMAYVITSPRSDLTQEQTTNPESQQDKYNPEFWTVNQPFYSISDALNMTPPGAVSASYVDLESMTPQMMQWARQYMGVNEVDTIYKSNTTKMYFANIQEGKNRSFLLLSTMSPERNDFEYIVYPEQYGNYIILKRQETNLNGLYNVLGTPSILAPGNTIGEVLGIITSLNKTVTAFDQYGGLLGRVEQAPYQNLSSNVSFAKQYYTGIRVTNGSYERTSAYLGINSSTLKKLNQVKANSTQRGLALYNITQSGNYTIVRAVSPDLFNVLPNIEEAS